MEKRAAKRQAKKKVGDAKNPPKLGKFEKEALRDFEKDKQTVRVKSKRVPGARGSATGRNTAGGHRTSHPADPNKKPRKRKPPPVPAHKTLDEIKAMDPDDPQFKHSGVGGKRKPHTTAETTEGLTYREVIKREKQRSANAARARARKAEAVTAKALEETGIVKKVRTVEGEVIDDEEVLIAEGVLDLDSWDAEELARGYRRQRNGRFGTPPKFIPREVQQEAFRRLVRRGERMLKESYLQTIQDLITLASEAESEKVRLDAITKIQERLVGKVPETIRVGVESPWQDMLADSVETLGAGDVVLEFGMNDEGVAEMVDEPEGV